MEGTAVMRAAMKSMPFVALCALIIAVPPVWANWVQDGVALCTGTADQLGPAIISDGAGGAIVTWWDYRNSTNDGVYIQRLNASGVVKWTAGGVALCTAMGFQSSPTIVSDGAGGAIVTWEDDRNGNSHIYAQRVNASGAVQWTINGVAVCAATGDQHSPMITSDNAGGAVVTWEDYRDWTSQIYAQRVNASGTPQWTANGVALSMTTGDQRYPTITSDGGGGAVVTWDDYRSGSADIYAQRVNASGAVQWGANGVALCTATGEQQDPAIAADGEGGALFTWPDYRSGIYADIYAQRVNASGTVQWTTDGVALCTATRDQLDPTLTSDGTGGSIVTWFDFRSGIYSDIYAQRVNASGAVQWAPNGVGICAATGYQEFPTIVSDGESGAIVTWHDYRSEIGDIYAQRLSASGAVRWTANGVALCTAAGPQGSTAIVSDGAGGAIVAWQDYRGGTNWDIYSQRVDANGFLVLTATDAPAVPIELHQNYPNPFNPTTTITYSIPEKSNVTLKVYDVSGKCIARLVDGEQEKGVHAVEWVGKDEKGTSVASGIYLYRLAAGNRTISRKMVLLR